MAERNLCAESGCKAFCCKDMRIHFEEASREQILKYWPEARETRALTLREIFNTKGVYFEKIGTGYLVRIFGYCPNVDAGFGCKL